jgi:hypothetical protein
MLSNEAEYFLERAIIEREMAKAANHPNAVAAHEKMAQQYDALIKERMRSTFQAVTAPRISEGA